MPFAAASAHASAGFSSPGKNAIAIAAGIPDNLGPVPVDAIGLLMGRPPKEERLAGQGGRPSAMTEDLCALKGVAAQTEGLAAPIEDLIALIKGLHALIEDLTAQIEGVDALIEGVDAQLGPRRGPLGPLRAVSANTTRSTVSPGPPEPDPSIPGRGGGLGQWGFPA